jgi:hypothetical protein
LGSWGAEVFPERRIVLQGNTTLIGRSNRDQGVEPEIDLGIYPADRGVSTQHAVMRIRDSGLTVTDLGSTNGTSLNGSNDCYQGAKKSRWPTVIAYTGAPGPRSRSCRLRCGLDVELPAVGFPAAA